jgi:polar amino acid transport system substrate-binding protein
MLRSRACLLALLLFPVLAQALTLRLCTDEKSHRPYLTPEGGGTAGLLIQLSAREVGIDVQFYPAPTTRCREEIRVGLADGFPITPHTPALEPFMAYPMKKGKPDGERAVMTARTAVFRRSASSVDWDGSRFSGLSTPVLVPFGAVLLVDRLKAMDVAMDDKGKSLDANLVKLLAGRADAAIGSETSGFALLADPQFKGKVEMLPIAFSAEPYFLGLNKQYYEANSELLEKLWTAMGRIRKSPAYLKQYEAALAQAARELKE